MKKIFRLMRSNACIQRRWNGMEEFATKWDKERCLMGWHTFIILMMSRWFMFTALKLQLTFMKKENCMLTEMETFLIRLLKSLGFDKDTTLAIDSLCETDENRKIMFEELVKLYREKGSVTQHDTGMILLRLIGDRKTNTSP